MNIEIMVGRVKARFLDGEAVPSDEVIAEFVRTVSDRLTMILGALPAEAESIVVDASMKGLRRRGYEGSSSESAADGGSFSNAFVANILAEYELEILQIRKKLNSGIKFL